MTEPAALASLPLFPLGTVLYPGGTLELQIFEVRYLHMIGTCVKTGAPFGVVSLTEGSEVLKPDTTQAHGTGFAKEAFHHVGTLANITEFAAPQAGLMRIRCRGMQRFRIARQERLKHGLWIADITLLPADDQVAIPQDLQGIGVALKNLIHSLEERQQPEQHAPVLPPLQFDDCGWVANRWCELLPVPPELKQRLMALDNPLVRLELVGDILRRTGIVP